MDVVNSTMKTWVWCGKAVPRSEITYIVQSTVLIIVIVVSLINLSLDTGDHDLNICLLCSSLGAFLPGPIFPVTKEKTNLNQDDIDSTPKRVSDDVCG